jgi:hypothetical protein
MVPIAPVGMPRAPRDRTSRPLYAGVNTDRDEGTRRHDGLPGLRRRERGLLDLLRVVRRHHRLGLVVEPGHGGPPGQRAVDPTALRASCDGRRAADPRRRCSTATTTARSTATTTARSTVSTGATASTRSTTSTGST